MSTSNFFLEKYIIFYYFFNVEREQGEMEAANVLLVNCFMI